MNLENIENELSECIRKLSNEQKEKLIKKLIFHNSVDSWPPDIAEIRNGIYSAYSSEIAGLIAKIEVYAHDLPPRVGSHIEFIWQLMSIATNEADQEKKALLYQSLEKYIVHVVNELRSILIGFYVQAIKGYRRTLKNFKHNAVKDVDGIPVLDKTRSNLKTIGKYVKQGKKIQRHQYSKSDGIISVKYDAVTEIVDFSEALVLSEKTTKLLEEKYPIIIGNGYNSSLLKRVLWAIPDVVAACATAYGFWQLILIIYPVLFP